MCQIGGTVGLLHNFTGLTLRTDGLYLPNLFIHELAVAHSKANISLLFVIVFADTLVVNAPHQKETCAKLVEQVDYSMNLYFSLCGQMAHVCQT